LAIGLVFVGAYFPLLVALGLDTPDSLLQGDIAQHVVGQRYYIGDAWRWPLFFTPLLKLPDGVNIFMTDSIPVAALIAKLISKALSHPVTLVPAWLAFCYLMQPLAAVYALRGTEERRLIPALCVAIMAICLPTLLFRAMHIALCSHFLLLTAIGLYARIQRDGRPRRAAMTGLCVVSLLVTPYLLAMVAASLSAAPLSLLLRRQRAWRQVALGLLLSLMCTASLAWLLGYGGKTPHHGFGYYSMNLLSPIYPASSSLLGGIVADSQHQMDATGGQYEGYQYLGLGLLFLVAIAALAQGPVKRGAQLRRHAGLVCVCLALTILAASNTIYVGHRLLIALGPVPGFIQQFRSSGRFFWPVSYVLLIGAVSATLRNLPQRIAYPILVLAASLQFADSRELRRELGWRMKSSVPVVIDELRMHALLEHARLLVLWPTADCSANVVVAPEFMATIIAASDTLVPVNTMYTARRQAIEDCNPAHSVGLPLAPGEVRVFMPEAASNAAAIVPEGRKLCRSLRNLAVCTRNEAVLVGLPPAPIHGPP
jgi:hypothetical protein